MTGTYHGGFKAVMAGFAQEDREYRKARKAAARLRKFRARMRQDKPETRVKFCAWKIGKGRIEGC